MKQSLLFLVKKKRTETLSRGRGGVRGWGGTKNDRGYQENN